jgi:hypothetical protein
MQVTQDRRPAPSNGDKPNPALIDFREFRIVCGFGVKIEPLGIDAGNLRPEFGKAQGFAGRIASRNVSITLRHLGEKFRLQEETRRPLPAAAAGG